MKEKKLKYYLYLIIVSSVGLLLMQAYWINHVLQLENKIFIKTAKESLFNTMVDAEKLEAKKSVIKYFDINTSQNFIFYDNKSENGKVVTKQIIQKSSNSHNNNTLTKNNFQFEFNTDTDNDSVVTKIIVVNGDTVIDKSTSKAKIDSLKNKKAKILNNLIDDIILVGKIKRFDERFPKPVMDSLLKTNLYKKGIKEKFNFAVIEKSKDSLIYASTKVSSFDFNNPEFIIEILPNSFSKEKNFLIVTFNRSFTKILQSIMGTIIISILLIGVIVFVFYKTLQSYLGQKRLNAVKTDIINNLTHEFKTPISSIALANNAIKAHSDNNIQKYITIIDEENNRLKVMIDNILTAAKLETGEISIKISKVNIAELVDNVIDKFKLSLENTNGEVISEYIGEPPVFMTDFFHLQNIISNLIDNAIKYCDKSPQIKISIKLDENALFVSVEDNGIGIEKKYYEKIFESFYRIPTGNIYKGKGYGIGLSYVKKAVKSLGGYVLVNSVLKTGTTFTVVLPKNYEN